MNILFQINKLYWFCGKDNNVIWYSDVVYAWNILEIRIFTIIVPKTHLEFSDVYLQAGIRSKDVYLQTQEHLI